MSDEWNQEHQQDHGQGHDEHQEPENQAEEAVEETQVEEETPVLSPSTRSRAGLFSRADVENIVTFVRALDTATERHRADALSVLGYLPEANPLEVAFAIYPSGGLVTAFDSYADIVVKHIDGSLGFQDGMQFAATVAEMTNDTVKHLSSVHNTFAPEDHSIRYRRNMPSVQVTNAVTNALAHIPPETKDSLNFVSDLLGVWPGRS